MPPDKVDIREANRNAGLFQRFGDTVGSFFGPWFDSYHSLLRLNVEAQQVIGLRVMKMVRGGKHAEMESQRMISEKLSAFAEAQIGMMTDIATGQGFVAPARAIAVLQREVSANRRRLSR